MEASDDRTNAAVAQRLDSNEERARFIEAEKAKYQKIAEHQAKIASRKAPEPSAGDISTPSMSEVLKKQPDRKFIHEVIDNINDLGYLLPA
jgi:hypothetical protein